MTIDEAFVEGANTALKTMTDGIRKLLKMYSLESCDKLIPQAVTEGMDPRVRKLVVMAIHASVTGVLQAVEENFVACLADVAMLKSVQNDFGREQ